MKCLIWDRADGGISVERPAFGDRNRPSTDDELIAMCQRKTQIRLTLKYGGPATCHVVDEKSLPDGYFFNAYRWDGAKVVVGMPEARGIHMDIIRAERNKQLAALDVPFMRAVEAGDQTAQKQIASRKQQLRDLPQQFDLKSSPDTPEALIRKWPDNLERGKG